MGPFVDPSRFFVVGLRGAFFVWVPLRLARLHALQPPNLRRGQVARYLVYSTITGSSPCPRRLALIVHVQSGLAGIGLSGTLLSGPPH